MRHISMCGQFHTTQLRPNGHKTIDTQRAVDLRTRDGVGAAKERIKLALAGNRSLYSQPVIF